MRLTSSFWVAAYLRQCHSLGAFAVVRRRGASESGAIFVVLDRLDGTKVLFEPAPQSVVLDGGNDRRFTEVPELPERDEAVEARLAREIKFDPDMWIVVVEDRSGRHFLELV